MGAPVSFGGADHRERLGFLADVFPVRSDVLDGVAHHQSHRAAQQRIQPPNQCDGSDGRRNLNLSLFGLCSTNHGVPLEFSSAFSMVHRLHTKCRLTARAATLLRSNLHCKGSSLVREYLPQTARPSYTPITPTSSCTAAALSP